jgi:phage-related protein
MIVFNGVDITQVAPVKIEDIRVSPIKYNPVIRPRAIRYGAEFVRMGGGERTVTISFALLVRDMIARQTALARLSEWAKTDGEHRIELSIDTGRYLTGVCTSKPEPSARAWWENKLRFVFTCYENPYWTSKQEKTVSCGTAFTALGDAPPLMRIERTLAAAAQNQTYSNGTQSMTFSQIPAGYMVIDLNAQTARVGNTSIMQYYQPSGSFIFPKPGAQTITGTGSVKYRERWE